MNLFSAALALVLASSTVASKTAHAFEETWQAQRNQDHYWVVIHTEGDQHFVVDTFKKKPGELQDLVQSRTFANLSEAKQFAHEERKRIARTPQWEVRSLNEPRDDGAEKSFTDDLPLPSLPPLWEVRHAWTWEWEQTYGRWVSENLTAEFFKNHGIATDCADIAFATRWIFARIHGLPAANRLGGSRALFTQDSTREAWLALPTDPTWHQDRRFLKALNYLLGNTFTHTLGWDTYPIAMIPEAILPGTIELHIGGSSGHTLIIHRVGAPGTDAIPLMTINSTIPREIRDLSVQAFSMSRPEQGSESLVRPLWPERTPLGWRLVEAERMPHYSHEQFSENRVPEGESFASWLMKLINPDFNPGRLLGEAIHFLERTLQERVGIVEAGHAACKTEDCSPGTPGWENWSTPSRDGRIAETFLQINALIDQISDIDDGARDRWKNWLLNTRIEVAGRKYTAERILWNAIHHLLDTDPRVTPEERWRLTPRSYLGKVLPPWLASLNARNERALSRENPCRENFSENTCKPGGAAYTQWSTIQEDEALSDTFIRWTALENLLDSEEKIEWREHFETHLQSERSQREWLSYLAHLNGDPRAVLAQRNAAAPSDLKHLVVIESQTDTYDVSRSIWVDDEALTLLIASRNRWDKRGLLRYTFSDKKQEVIASAAFHSPDALSGVEFSETSPPILWTATPEHGTLVLRTYDHRGTQQAQATIPEAISGVKISTVKLSENGQWMCLSFQNDEPSQQWINFGTGTVLPVVGCDSDKTQAQIVHLYNGDWIAHSRLPHVSPRRVASHERVDSLVEAVEGDDGWLVQNKESTLSLGSFFWAPHNGSDLIPLRLPPGEKSKDWQWALPKIKPSHGRTFLFDDTEKSKSVKLIEVDLTTGQLSIRQTIDLKTDNEKPTPGNPPPMRDDPEDPNETPNFFSADPTFHQFFLSPDWGGTYYSTVPMIDHAGTSLFRWVSGLLKRVSFPEPNMKLGHPLDLKTGDFWTASTTESASHSWGAIYRWDGNQGFTRWSPRLAQDRVRMISNDCAITLQNKSRLLFFTLEGHIYAYDGTEAETQNVPLLTNIPRPMTVSGPLGTSDHMISHQFQGGSEQLSSFAQRGTTKRIAVWKKVQ